MTSRIIKPSPFFPSSPHKTLQRGWRMSGYSSSSSNNIINVSNGRRPKASRLQGKITQKACRDLSLIEDHVSNPIHDAQVVGLGSRSRNFWSRSRNLWSRSRNLWSRSRNLRSRPRNLWSDLKSCQSTRALRQNPSPEKSGIGPEKFGVGPEKSGVGPEKSGVGPEISGAGLAGIIDGPCVVAGSDF